MNGKVSILSNFSAFIAEHGLPCYYLFLMNFNFCPVFSRSSFFVDNHNDLAHLLPVTFLRHCIVGNAVNGDIPVRERTSHFSNWLCGDYWSFWNQSTFF